MCGNIGSLPEHFCTEKDDRSTGSADGPGKSPPSENAADRRRSDRSRNDPKNRTASNLRNCFTKGQGSVGTQGCVSFMFDEKGQIIIDKEECDMDADELMMIALDAGADDFEEEEDSFEILTTPEDFDAVHKALEESGISMVSAEVTMIPQTYVTLTDEQDIKNINRILDMLDDDDDVQEVYHNWDE